MKREEAMKGSWSSAVDERHPSLAMDDGVGIAVAGDVDDVGVGGVARPMWRPRQLAELPAKMGGSVGDEGGGRGLLLDGGRPMCHRPTGLGKEMKEICPRGNNKIIIYVLIS